MRGPCVLVFIQEGCPACHEYMKRFDKVAPRYYQDGRGVPVQVGDVSAEPAAIRMADRYDVDATPTTVGIARNGDVIKLVGAVGSTHIRQMFDNVSK